MNRLRHLMSLCIFISLMACEQNEDWVVNEPMQSYLKKIQSTLLSILFLIGLVKSDT